MLFINYSVHINQIQLILIIILCFLLALTLFVLILKIFNKLKLAKIRRMGQKGENLAVKYLHKMGYHILEQQATLNCVMKIDNTPKKFIIRADFLVEKNGRKGVVEVKSGTEVSKPWQLDTRRQLLEYFHYYPVEYVLIFNSQQKILQEIDF